MWHEPHKLFKLFELRTIYGKVKPGLVLQVKMVQLRERASTDTVIPKPMWKSCKSKITSLTKPGRTSSRKVFGIQNPYTPAQGKQYKRSSLTQSKCPIRNDFTNLTLCSTFSPSYTTKYAVTSTSSSTKDRRMDKIVSSTTHKDDLAPQ